MAMDPLSDAKIIESWHRNALPWTNIVREGKIESRRLSTDQAIVNAILSCSPQTVLDIGCGEGWLVRELAAKNIRATGIDVVPALITQAKQEGGGDFHVVSYEEIAAGQFRACVDVVVCNFSLLGKASVEEVFRAAPLLQNTGGSFIVQTLHPVTACGDYPYRDGWREGSWEGFGANFTDPAPWYFRTLESWTKLILENGFSLLEMREPIHPNTKKPISVIFIAKRLGLDDGNE